MEFGGKKNKPEPVNLEELDPVLTLQEVADFLQVNPRTVRRIIGSGDLEAFNVGDTIRVQREKLAEYLTKAKGEVANRGSRSY